MTEASVVLVVDDLFKNVELLDAYLEPEGYEVLKASSGEEALTLLLTKKIDIVLLDVMMPGINGFEVAQKIRDNKNLQHIPIILVTALNDPEDRVKGIVVGCDDFLTKPVDKSELLARTRSLIKLSSYRKQIEKANQQLISLNLDKNKLVSIVGHDLRNSFYGITEASKIIRKSLHGIQEPKIQEILEFAEAIQHTSENSSRLLEGLLNWALINKESTNTVPEIIELKPLVMEIALLFKENLLAKNLQFSEKIESPQVYGDKEMIKAVLRNLMANAIKFTPKNGKIQVNSALQGPMTHITVVDTGVGMSTRALEKLFKLESKFSTNGTENEKGTGLGLILCKDIVEKNGGSIQVESIPDKGSKFIVILPFSQREPTFERVKSLKNKILIVDDNLNTLELEKDLLEREGFQVLEAQTAAQGIAMAKNTLPDLIIMDVRLPDMRGSRAAKMLRLDETTKDIPIVFVTSVAHNAGQDEIRDVTISGFIEKPINTRTFASQICEYLK